MNTYSTITQSDMEELHSQGIPIANRHYETQDIQGEKKRKTRYQRIPPGSGTDRGPPAESDEAYEPLSPE